jgi:hypothetical protein
MFLGLFLNYRSSQKFGATFFLSIDYIFFDKKVATFCANFLQTRLATLEVDARAIFRLNLLLFVGAVALQLLLTSGAEAILFHDSPFRGIRVVPEKCFINMNSRVAILPLRVNFDP